ncbi:MAG: nucleotidyltransferase domain-containing protein [Calothrix sp. SM1_5_4]|nr:nucleotidyltransferase domain-containing protein [Calothrix sp. SM1_5_4]
MRLKDSEIRSLRRALEPHLLGRPFRLYLFGSRVDNAKRGGDIDLLLEVETSLKGLLLDKKGRIKSDLGEAVGDQRVDLTICAREDMEEDPFLNSVASDAVLLFRG